MEVHALPSSDLEMSQAPPSVTIMEEEVALGFEWAEALSMPIFVLDCSGASQTVVVWTKTMEAISGVAAETIVSHSLSFILDPYSIQQFSYAMDDILVDKQKSASCLVSLPESQKNLSLKLSVYQKNNTEEAPYHVVCFAEANEEMKEEQIVLPSAFAAAAMDYTFQIVAWNFRLEEYSLFQSEDMLGRCFLDLIPDRDDQLSLKAAVDKTNSDSKQTKMCSVKMALGGGRIKKTNIHISNETTDPTGSPVHHFIFSDAADLMSQHEATTSVANASQLEKPCCSSRQDENVLNSMNAVRFEIDTTGDVILWNDYAVDVTGFASSDILHKKFISSFVPVEKRLEVQNVIDCAFSGFSTSNFELFLEGKDSELKVLLANTTPRWSNEKNIASVIFFAQDITETFKHTIAISAAANELRLLIDTANAPIFGIDRDGDVNEWNEKAAEITGYTKEEVFDCSLLDNLIVPSMKDSVREVLDNALEGHETSNFELEFRTKANEIRHLLVNVTTRRDVMNNVVGAVGVTQDITEAVQRDRAVAGMALELRQLIDTANAPIFGIDIDGNVNEWNRRTSEITGYTKEEAFDEPLVETFIVEPMRERVREILEAALQGKETSNYELEFVSKSGDHIVLLVNATTRRDPENSVVGVVGVAQDVTEDRKHSLALREMQYIRASQEAKVETERNMTAYFAHELRNPLGAIDSALNAMPDDLPEAASTLVAGMQLCSGFMSSIMNNLLDVRKMEEGKMTLSKSPISLKKVLYSVYKMLLPSVRPGVRFEKVCNTEGKDWVLGDAHRIQQVLTNVITNAIKYTVQGSIRLQIGWENDLVIFECIDTGPGIPKNEQEKLFQRFVQRGGAPGTGLGLAIAKHLVDLSGGSIRFESDPSIRAGTNCVVHMALPLCNAPETVIEESSALINEPLAFLIIDDIKMNRMMLKRRILKGIAPKATVREAATGEEALEICAKEKFDVIVVDQYMEEAGGVMVGTDVVFAMRRMRIDSIVIGCSGNDMGTQFFEAGADWVWQKPMPSNGEIIKDLRVSRRKQQATATAKV